MFLFQTVAPQIPYIRKMYLKVLCCIHFVEKLTESRICHEINSHFDCSRDNEKRKIVVVKCDRCVYCMPWRFYYNHLRISRCFCNEMGRNGKCTTCMTIRKIINTVAFALKVCVRKERFPAGQIYFSIKKYLTCPMLDFLFIVSKITWSL